MLSIDWLHPLNCAHWLINEWCTSTTNGNSQWHLGQDSGLFSLSLSLSLSFWTTWCKTKYVPPNHRHTPKGKTRGLIRALRTAGENSSSSCSSPSSWSSCPLPCARWHWERRMREDLHEEFASVWRWRADGQSGILYRHLGGLAPAAAAPPQKGGKSADSPYILCILTVSVHTTYSS